MDDPRTAFFAAGGVDLGEDAFQARKLAFAQTVSDYEQVMSRAYVQIPPYVADYIKASTVGPALGYFLAKNLETCRRIAWMPHARAIQELTRLASKLRAPRLVLVHNADDARRTVVDQDCYGDGAECFPAPAPPVCTWADDAELRRRVMAFAATVPDYHETLKGCCWRVPGHINAYLRTSVRAPEVGYYLAKHRQIFETIVAASPIEAVAQLLALERELDEWRWRCLIRMLTPEELYSLTLLAVPTPEESRAARRLLHLVACLADAKTAN